MSSFSRLRSRKRRGRLTAALAALLVAASGLHPGAARAAAPQLDIVAVDVSGDRRVSLVVDVRTTGKTSDRSSAFSVTVGDVPLPTRAVPVIPDSPALAVVVDTSTAGSAALQEGLSGAANLLLQLPTASRIAVVADTSPPVVLAPARPGGAAALRALSALRAQGERATSEALSLAVRQLPAIAGGRRVVVLYTSGPDAEGASVSELVRRMAAADALLAVVSRGTGTRYWSRVASATGGVLVTPGPSAVMSAFDEVATALRGRYVLTFQIPEGLPAEVSVRVSTDEGQQTAQALVSPGQVGSTEPLGSAFQEGDSVSNFLWFLVLGLVVLVGVVVALRSSARRPPFDKSPDIAVTHQRLDSVLGAPGSRPVPAAPPLASQVPEHVPDGPPGVYDDVRDDARDDEPAAETEVPPELPEPPAPHDRPPSVVDAVAAAERRARAVGSAARLAAKSASTRRVPRPRDARPDAPESDSTE